MLPIALKRGEGERAVDALTRGTSWGGEGAFLIVTEARVVFCLLPNIVLTVHKPPLSRFRGALSVSVRIACLRLDADAMACVPRTQSRDARLQYGGLRSRSCIHAGKKEEKEDQRQASSYARSIPEMGWQRADNGVR